MKRLFTGWVLGWALFTSCLWGWSFEGATQVTFLTTCLFLIGATLAISTWGKDGVNTWYDALFAVPALEISFGAVTAMLFSSLVLFVMGFWAANLSTPFLAVIVFAGALLHAWQRRGVGA